MDLLNEWSPSWNPSSRHRPLVEFDASAACSITKAKYLVFDGPRSSPSGVMLWILIGSSPAERTERTALLPASSAASLGELLHHARLI